MCGANSLRPVADFYCGGGWGSDAAWCPLADALLTDSVPVAAFLWRSRLLTSTVRGPFSSASPALPLFLLLSPPPTLQLPR